jgi:DNA-binding transcriptional ArsR family regulator
MNTIFDVIADPNRRRILEILHMSQPLISKHLRVLREANLVSVRQDAQRHWYELRPEPLAELVDWLEPYRQLQEARFNRLENLLQNLQEKEKHDDEN